MTELRRKSETDYYRVLQVDADAEIEVIEAAYRALSKKYHPDLNDAATAMDRMSQINSAYTVLSDPDKRRDYNYLRRAIAPHVATPRNTTPKKTETDTSSFRPSTSPKAEKSSFRPQPTTTPHMGATVNRKSYGGVILIGVVALVTLAVALVLAMEMIFNNPLKTSFLKQVPPTPIGSPTRVAVGSILVPTVAPTLPPTSRENILAYLNNPDLYAGRVSDVALSGQEVLQLKVRLAPNGAVLNSETISVTTRDELDPLRQAESTTYNLVYSLFGRFQDLNRVNLVITDSKDKPFYRADVGRGAAFTFYPWHANFNINDMSEVMKAARQDRLGQHFGVLLDDNLHSRLTAPSEANIQAELQSLGLVAVTVNSSNSLFNISYAQARTQAEIAVDFSRILYGLYTRFPSLDQMQIVLYTSADKPAKVINRQLFNQVGLESWSQASYGSDRQAQTLIASLPGNIAALNSNVVPLEAGFKVPIQVNTWAVVAENLERYEALVLEGLRFPAGRDRQFVVVKVAIRNASDGRQWLMPGERMSLVDTFNSVVYPSDPTATLLYILKSPPAEEPPPGPIEATKQGTVYGVFNIPASVNLNGLRLQFVDGDKRALVEIS